MQTNTMKKTGGHILLGLLLSSAIAACQPVPLPDNAAFSKDGAFLGEKDETPISPFAASLFFFDETFEVEKILANNLINQREEVFHLVTDPNGDGKITYHYTESGGIWAPLNSVGAAAKELNDMYPVSLAAQDVSILKSSLGRLYVAEAKVQDWSDRYCLIFVVNSGRNNRVSVNGHICTINSVKASDRNTHISRSKQFLTGVRYQ